MATEDRPCPLLLLDKSRVKRPRASFLLYSVPELDGLIDLKVEGSLVSLGHYISRSPI